MAELNTGGGDSKGKKVRSKKQDAGVDLTAMVDLAFLLVTFFMLTSSFRAPEPVFVDPPTSTTDDQIPKQVFLVTVDEKGRVFIDLTNPAVKELVLKDMMRDFKVQMSSEEVKKFAGAGPIGLKMESISSYLELEVNARAKVQQSGVPYELLDRAGIARVEPALAAVTDKLAGALRLPNDQTGDCQMFTEKLAEMAKQLGVESLCNQPCNVAVSAEARKKSAIGLAILSASQSVQQTYHLILPIKNQN